MAKVIRSFIKDDELDKLKAPKTLKDYYKDAGQPGLYLSISSSGARAWECQFKIRGTTKVRWRTIGYYRRPDEGANSSLPLMSLSDARKVAEKARVRARKGKASRTIHYATSCASPCSCQCAYGQKWVT